MPTSDRAFRLLARAQPESVTGLLRAALPDAVPASFAIAPFMIAEMERQELEPVIVQDLFFMGEDAGFERGLEAGRKEGRAAALLDVLRARGLEVPGPVVERVMACSDPAELARLLARAVSVSRAEQLFEA